MQQARVCLAPLQFGAGLKGKLIDAMKNGTPCVMSSIAAEGMFGDSEPNGFIEDNPNEFASKAGQLYTDEPLWNEKQQNGFNIINSRFNKASIQSEFVKRLNNLKNELQKHREQNIVGQIIQHESLKSTKYMSKWIEEKNKE